MKIVVIGGTGLIGSKTVAILRQGGHEVVAASPKSGINTITGEELYEALAGAQVVVETRRGFDVVIFGGEAAGISVIGAWTRIPALLTRMSSRPKVSMAALIAAVQSASLDTS